MRRLAVLLVLLACCAREKHVVMTGGMTSNFLDNGTTHRYAKDGYLFRSYEMTLPAGLDRDNEWREMRLIDDAGESYRIITAHFSTSNNEPRTIGATFEIPKARHPYLLIAGHYAIDVRDGRITRTDGR